ncbi:DUF58 domain-containing protein [Persicimonas caeni]|uniref:DUF58 domain-containing protein n=1 Tax=Persicimonas caeni TaxID=2292766 RepID=A0A4Y6Q2A8_PERCE|nr:DUF58 domain-containing protein [Persicimonas caeni]QDG54125.1 DUF58 domain-containing protein [Persicimonas caeni]QED35346.1 DUF58 domain-containing protein [Persicimonas caeni]
MAKNDQFDDEFLKKLEYLYIISKKIVAGKNQAERKTRIVGSGIEFADHRSYSPGDDFRGLDWKVYARTEKLFLRLFEEEEDLYIYFLLDCSRSMLLGEPTKWDYAKKVAAALGYIGLSNLDRVSIIPFSSKLDGRLPPSRGKAQIYKIFDFLRNLEAGEHTSLEDAFSTFVAQNKRRGIAVVLSDFYDPRGFEEGLNKLRYHKFEPIVVHVYDERELNPTVQGELQLVDVETGDVREITLTPEVVKEYRQAFYEFSEELEEYCTKKQVLYFRTPIQEPFDELILRIFRAGGFIK